MIVGSLLSRLRIWVTILSLPSVDQHLVNRLPGYCGLITGGGRLAQCGDTSPGRENTMLYRLAAQPAPWMTVDEVIVEDQQGRLYLLSGAAPRLLPLCREDADLLGAFFEPSQDSTWHSAADLWRMLFARRQNDQRRSRRRAVPSSALADPLEFVLAAPVTGSVDHGPV